MIPQKHAPGHWSRTLAQKNNSFTIDSLNELKTGTKPPYLSLYQPTHRFHPDNLQDPIRFGNLVKVLMASLRQKHTDAEIRLLMEPFEALARDDDFWNHALDGLAVLGGTGLFRVYRLQRPVAELAVAADSFHTKPLRRFLQSVDRFQILGLSLHAIRLFEGNRDALDEVDPAPGVPRTITDALGDTLPDPHLGVSASGGVGEGIPPMYHGHGGKKDVVDIDADRFFRAVDRAILEHHSRPSGLPLMLAALTEHHHRFHRISHNPFLLPGGLTINPNDLSPDALRQSAWLAVEPHYRKMLSDLAEEFSVAKSRGLGDDDMAEVVRAAAGGRVATLLIEADRLISGRLDGSTGEAEAADLDDPRVDDLLDDLSELVVAMGGRVMVIPADQMPTRTGLAATYRY